MSNWNLFKEMDQLHREIDSLFRGAGLGQMYGSLLEPGYGDRHYPRVNLREDADNLYVEALVPGIDPKQLEISMLGGTLTLSGERPVDEEAANGRTWHRRERGHGKFLRTIELPVEVDAEKIKADAKHGLLQVVLPKAAVAKPKRIDIKVK